MIRLVFPGSAVRESLEESSWDDWFGQIRRAQPCAARSGGNRVRAEEQLQQVVSRESVEGSDSGRRPSQRSKNGKSPIARTPAGGNADFNVGEGADVEEEFEMEATAVRGRATASAGRRQRAQRKSGGGGRTGMAFESGCREGRSALTAGRHRGGGREVLGAPERQKTCRTGSASAGKIEQGATPAAGGRLGA